MKRPRDLRLPRFTAPRLTRRSLLIAAVLVLTLGIGVWWVVAVTRAPGSRHAGEAGSATADGPSPGDDRAHGDGEPHREGVVAIPPERQRSLGIEVEPAAVRPVADQLTVTGEVVANPNRSVVIAPRTSGRVTRILVQLGQTVKAGQTLALVDSAEVADLIGELQQAESALELARARLDREKPLYDAKLRMLETARTQPNAEAALAQLDRVELGRPKQEYISALATLELARADYDRQTLLSEAKIGARKELIRAEKDLYAARSELAAVEETIRLTARQELFAMESALREARAQSDKVHAKLHLLGLSDATLARSAALAHGQRPLTSLIAPFSGTVIDRAVTEGQLVDPTSVAFRVADLGTVWILLDVYEKDLGKVAVGRPVTISVTAYPDQRFEGKITYITDVLEEKTRTAKVRVEVPNPHRTLKPAMFAEATIATQAAKSALVVPKSAVVYLVQGPAVFVETREGFEPRQVRVGEEGGDTVVIAEGVREGERVAVRGGYSLKAELLKEQFGEAH